MRHGRRWSRRSRRRQASWPMASALLGRRRTMAQRGRQSGYAGVYGGFACGAGSKGGDCCSQLRVPVGLCRMPYAD